MSLSGNPRRWLIDFSQFSGGGEPFWRDPKIVDGLGVKYFV